MPDPFSQYPRIGQLIEALATHILILTNKERHDSIRSDIIDMIQGLASDEVEIRSVSDDAHEEFGFMAVRKKCVSRTLRYTAGNKAKAARALGINVKTFRYWLKRYSIDYEEVKKTYSIPGTSEIVPWVVEERIAIFHAMQAAAGNKTLAARLLGVSPKTIYNLLRKHGLYKEDLGDFVQWGTAKALLRDPVPVTDDVVTLPSGRNVLKDHVHRLMCEFVGDKLEVAERLDIGITDLYRILDHYKYFKFGEGDIVNWAKVSLSTKVPEKMTKEERQVAHAMTLSQGCIQQAATSLGVSHEKLYDLLEKCGFWSSEAGHLVDWKRTTSVELEGFIPLSYEEADDLDLAEDHPRTED